MAAIHQHGSHKARQRVILVPRGTVAGRGGTESVDFCPQGPSPDEVALVEGARKLGFEFRGRTRSHLTINFQGREVRGLSHRRSSRV